MISPIVGMHFRPPARAILGQLGTGARLILRPEPTNAFDANAFAVYVAQETLRELDDDAKASMALIAEPMGFTLADILDAEEWHLGYIPRTVAAELTLTGDTEGTLSFTADGKPAITFDANGNKGD